MQTQECDILIVGAGPAGSSAAFSAAVEGFNVLMIDQKPIIGIPVRCAEYIPAPLLKEVDIGKDFIVQPVKGMKTILPDGSTKKTPAPGFMIRRDLFDQALARKAGEAGSRINLCSKLISMDKNGVVVRAKGVTYMVKARVIIGADGPHTRVGRWIGSCNINLIPAIQVTAGLTRPMDFIEVYFYKDIFGGYGWLFPKGSRANLGIAIRKREGIRCPLKEGLDRFIARLREWGKIKGKTSGCTAGWIPAEPPRDVVHENIMLAGDAAGQTHPISGAGVAQAVTCGMMAGKWAGRAIRADDMALLGGYNEEWQDIYGEAQELAYNKRVLMEKKWDDLDDILKICWVGFREYYEERKEQVVKD